MRSRTEAGQNVRTLELKSDWLNVQYILDVCATMTASQRLNPVLLRHVRKSPCYANGIIFESNAAGMDHRV